MRLHLITLMLFIACLHVSAKTYSQKVSLNLNGVTLAAAFDEIESQTSYTFFYNKELINLSAKVSVKLKDASIQTVMDELVKDQNLSYEIFDQTISIKPQTKRIQQFAGSTPPLQATITGRIINTDGQPVAGAAITVKGTKIGTSTNNSGDFSIEATLGATLIINSIGFKSKELIIRSTSAITITLDSDVAEMEEMVIKGYYTTTKKLNTGNVGVLKAEDIAKQPVSNPLAALSGRVAGLFIQEGNGAPGRAITVQLRGQNSLSNGNFPLYIVDGVTFNSAPLNTTEFIPGAGAPASPLNDISPSDIERIEVLKDADATAIYGSRGANGVIIITTKKGKTGKPEFTLNTYYGKSKASRLLPMMNTEEYLVMRKSAFEYDKRTPGANDFDVNGKWDKNRFTDWSKYFIGNTASIFNIQPSISGGTENLKYRISGEFRKETTVYPGDFYGRKGGGSINVNQTSQNKRFNLNFSANYILNKNKLPTSDLTNFIRLAPNAPALYDETGAINWADNTWTNPIASLLRKNDEHTKNLISNLTMGYSIAEGLTVKASFGYNQNQMNQINTTPSSTYNPALISDPNETRMLFLMSNEIESWIAEPQISYNKKTKFGDFDLLTGVTFQENTQKSAGTLGYGFTADELLENMKSASAAIIITDFNTKYRYNAVYSRLGYNYKDKYLLNLTARRDGSSRFGPGKKFGNFGAAGIGWIFSNERIVSKKLPFLSFGKIRGSIGTTGNDQIPDYKYLSTYSSYGYSYQGISGLYPTQLTNQFFAWERVNKLEAGIELGFLNDRIGLIVSYYRNRTTNQLVGYSLPDITGFNTIQYNLPATIENKGLEIELKSNIIKSKRINWNTSLMVTIPRNKLVSYPKIEASTFSTRYAIGEPLTISYRYNYTGINPSTGLYTFEDINKDNKINAASDRRFYFAGQDFYGGLSNQLSYNNFILDIFFSFTKQVAQNTIYNGTAGSFMAGLGNQPKALITENEKQPYSQLTSGALNTQRSLFDNSNAILTDASFIRLKNLALAWKIPNSWSGGKLFSSGKLFIQCQNLLTFTKYKGLDPEAQQTMTLPPLRTISGGFQVSF